MSVLRTLFGPGTWGAGGNLVAWVLCGGLGFGWLHAKEQARHLARMLQAEQHHEALQAQAAAHHEALAVQAAEHHAELKAQAAEHHEALKAHVTAVVPKPAARKPRGM
jgi:plasmid maintenance system killer protein